MTALVPDRITSADEQRLAASEAHDAVKVLGLAELARGCSD